MKPLMKNLNNYIPFLSFQTSSGTEDKGKSFSSSSKYESLSKVFCLKDVMIDFLDTLTQIIKKYTTGTIQTFVILFLDSTLPGLSKHIGTYLCKVMAFFHEVTCLV